tara:strand:- start:306 stop:584 length:279 start_codon:yes stop_codon:yes gene_type:complete
MKNLRQHEDAIREFFDQFDDVAEQASVLNILTNEMDFMAMDVLMRMLMTSLLKGDMPELTEYMAKFAQAKQSRDRDAISDLISQTQNNRGVN